eukprot:scaffold270_cov390-Prasinococcus_capsulatus_cf.AAC.6
MERLLKLHALAPHARLLDPQRLLVHSKRLLVPLLLYVHPRHVAQRLRAHLERLLAPQVLLVHRPFSAEHRRGLHVLPPPPSTSGGACAHRCAWACVPHSRPSCVPPWRTHARLLYCVT